MILVFDTSTDMAGVALYDQRGVLAEANWRVGRDHSAQVLNMAAQLMANLEAIPDELTGVGVALGPGSWSGLRVGLSAAKGIAIARDLPIVGISSLDILAFPHQRTGRSVMPLIKLGRERYATAEYRLRRAWGRIGTERNVSRAEFVETLPELALVCGDVDSSFAQAIQTARGAGVVVLTGSLATRRAGCLAELAWHRLQAGEHDDLVGLEPHYLGQAVKN